MSKHHLHPDPGLAQTIALIWLGFLAAGLLAWFAYRYWRKRYPLPPPERKRNYSHHLQRRLATNRGTGKRKRRGGSVKSQPRRN